MKILVVTNLCPPDYDGGFELSAFRNANSLRELGHDVTLVTSKFRDNYRGERIDSPWVRRIFKLSEVGNGWGDATGFLNGDPRLDFSIFRMRGQFALRMSNIKSLISTLKVAHQNDVVMSQCLSGEKFDVAYVFGVHMIGTSLLSAISEAGIPIVYHHGDEWLGFYLKPKMLKRIVLTACAPKTFARELRADTANIVLVSEFLKRRFASKGFDPAKMGVIYRGFELEFREDIDRVRSNPPVFLVAARITLYKGIHIAIQAAKGLDELMPDSPWELWIAGHGEPSSVTMLEELVETLQISHRVRFLGKLSREAVVDAMMTATAVISPSVFDEPLGNTNLEALASGTPLIASRSGAIEEIIEDNVSGMIYQRDRPQELVLKMARILTQPELARELAVNGMQQVKQKFRQDQIVAQVEDKLAAVAGISQSAVTDHAATLR